MQFYKLWIKFKQNVLGTYIKNFKYKYKIDHIYLSLNVVELVIYANLLKRQENFELISQ